MRLVLTEGVSALSLGDQGVLLDFGASTPDELRQVLGIAYAQLQSQAIVGVVELVPAYTSLAVYFRPEQLRRAALLAELARRAPLWKETLARQGPPRDQASRTQVIPTRYGGREGPDLAFVAEYHGLTCAELIARHSAVRYRVVMMGFAPGFPYLAGLPSSLATPRLDEPRLSVAAGSVGIGGSQTGIYPLASPGGWRIIGRTPLALLDWRREPPFLLAMGDYLRFEPL